jgi:hypothetical protein
LSSRRWAEEGRPSSALWRGHRLRELKQREVALRLDLAPDDLEFIRASRRAVVRRWAVRLAGLLGVVLGVVLIVTVRDTLERRAREEEQARKEAERREAIGRMVTRSRRTADPYVHVALLGAAIGLEADDPVLPLELLSTARDLPHAQFMSLRPVDRPQFPWGGRWLVGGGSGAYATVFDFTPLQDTPWGPVLHRFRPHPQGMDDLVAFPFDSAFVTRGLDGELRVWRIRLSGEIALAAVSPMRCLGGLNPVIVAERAPVVACATADGIARWDLRKVGEPQIDSFQGRVLHLSPNGDWLAAARLSRVLLWNFGSNRRYEFDAGQAPSFARFSPRDDVIASRASAHGTTSLRWCARWGRTCTRSARPDPSACCRSSRASKIRSTPAGTSAASTSRCAAPPTSGCGTTYARERGPTATARRRAARGRASG